MPWGTAGAQQVGTDREAVALGALLGTGLGSRAIDLNSSGVAAVQSWVNGSRPNHGFVIEDYTNSEGLAVSSADDPVVAHRPLLLVTYTAGGPSLTMGFQNGATPSTLYAGTVDTTLANGPNIKANNYNNSGLRVGGQPGGNPGGVVFGNAAVLLSFDVTSLPRWATVTGAGVELTVTQPSAQSYPLYEVLRDWVETGASWLNYDSTHPWAVAGATSSFDRAPAVLGELLASPTGQVTTALKRIIGDAQIDEFAQQTRSDQMDQTAVQLSLKIRAVAEQFETLFISGDSGGNAKQFDGLRVLCTGGNGNRVGCNAGAANGATPTLDDIDTLIDTVKGPVDLLVMSQRSKRKLKALFRANGAAMETRLDFGMPIEYYSGIPIATTNFIGDALTKGTSTDCSEIYAVSLQEGFGVVGLQNEKTMQAIERPDTGRILLPGPQVVPIGPMETVDANKWRVRWYTAIAAYSLRGIACLDGVRP